MDHYLHIHLIRNSHYTPDATIHTTSYHSTYLHTTSIHSRNNLTNTPNDSTTTSTNSTHQIFYPSTIANILWECNDRDWRWPLNSISHILPRQVATMIATTTKLSSNAPSPKPPPKILTITNTLRHYFTTQTTNTNSEYPNTNPQTNNTKDVKHPKRSRIISKTATLI